MEENLKRKEELQIVRRLKKDLNNPRYIFLGDESRALILNALVDYEHELINAIILYNNNVDLLNDMGIKSEKVELPRADMEVVRYPFENSLFKVYNDVKAVYLKDLVDMYSRGNPQDYGFTEEELKVLLKSLKEYAFSLQTIMKQIKNNRDIYNSLFEDTKVSEEPDHYVPLTQSKIQESLFDYLDKQQKRESETKENKNK